MGGCGVRRPRPACSQSSTEDTTTATTVTATVEFLCNYCSFNYCLTTTIATTGTVPSLVTKTFTTGATTGIAIIVT